MSMGQKVSGSYIIVTFPMYELIVKVSELIVSVGGGKIMGREQTTRTPGPRELAEELTPPARLDMLLDMPPASKESQLKYAWNSEDRSLNIFVKVEKLLVTRKYRAESGLNYTFVDQEDDKLTFHRHPVAQSTDCIRGKTGFTRGLHVWEIHWSTRQRGTHAVVGVATQEAPLNSVGYQVRKKTLIYIFRSR